MQGRQGSLGGGLEVKGAVVGIAEGKVDLSRTETRAETLEKSLLPFLLPVIAD